jgi:hypothetical protein
MLYFLILVSGALLALFGVLAYGAINDGLRRVFIVLSVVFSICLLALVVWAVFQSDTAPTVAGGTPSIPEMPLIRAAPVPPKPPPVATPAVLPPLAGKGTSFHLEPGRSSPLFRIPNGKKAHVTVYGGGVMFYSSGVAKLSCQEGVFVITGRGEGDQFVACDSVVDVVIDDMSD